MATDTLSPAALATAETSPKFGNPLGLSHKKAAKLQATINSVLKRSPGATQISQYEVTWDGGKALESFPAPGKARAPGMSPAALAVTGSAGANSGAPVNGASDSCPWYVAGDHFYCFYQDKNFNGRRLQWSYQYCYSYNLKPYINFTDYSFNDQASSWVNNGNHIISAYNNINAGGALLWQEGTVSNSPFVGSTANDKASSFKAC